MSFFKKDISKLADVLVNQSAIFNCSLEEAWEKWMHPVLTEQATFQEVKDYINKKVELGTTVSGVTFSNRDKKIPEGDLLTVEEFSRLFHVEPKDVYKWISEGKIKCTSNSPHENSDDCLIPLQQFEGKLITSELMEKARTALGVNNAEIGVIDTKELNGE